MHIPWPHYVSRKRPCPVLCITFSGGFKGLLWFADVTLHSIWRESFPGAVRQGPSFALLSFLLGAASGRGLSQTRPPRVDTNTALKCCRNTQKCTVCAYGFYCMCMAECKSMMTSIIVITFIAHTQATFWQAFKLVITLMHRSDYYQFLIVFLLFYPALPP